MANAVRSGTGSGKGKAKWALIHRVPIFPPPGAQARGAKIRWRPLTQWVRVGSPKWNRIMAASAKTGANITPTKYKNSVSRPIAPSAPPGSTVSDRLPVRAPNGNPIADAPGKGSKSPGNIPVGGGRGGAGRAGGGRRGGSGGGGAGRSAGFNAIGAKIGNPNIGQSIPKSLAKQLANLQFAPQINATRQQIALQQAQGAQNLKDISDWYAQAQQMQNQAGTAAAQGTQQAVASDNAATQAILNAIGGGANAGAGQVGGTGLAEAGAANLIGQIAQQYHANMLPALQTGMAEASRAQTALNSQAAAKLQDTLNTLLQSRGAAHAQAIMNIIQANNSLAQQRFGNKLSKLQAQDALMQLLGNQAVQASQIRGNNARTRAINAQLHAATGGSATHPKFSSLGPGDQLKLLQAWAVNPAGQLRSAKQAIGLANAQGYTSNFAHQAILKYITGVH